MAKLVDRAALEEFRKKLQSKRRKGKKKLISLCAGSGCGAYGTAKVHQALVDELKRQKLDKKVEVKLTGCHGFCEKGPIMVIHPEGIFYPQPFALPRVQPTYQECRVCVILRAVNNIRINHK